jgi:hypothetical protein
MSKGLTRGSNTIVWTHLSIDVEVREKEPSALFCKVVLTGLAQLTDVGIPVVLTTIVPLSPDTTEDYARRIRQGRR